MYRLPCLQNQSIHMIFNHRHSRPFRDTTLTTGGALSEAKTVAIPDKYYNTATGLAVKNDSVTIKRKNCLQKNPPQRFHTSCLVRVAAERVPNSVVYKG
ncbi:hypothetical protein KCV06_g132, partial [Aureobasidium melanogenum]